MSQGWSPPWHCFSALAPSPPGPGSSAQGISFSDTEDDFSHYFRTYISDVLSTAPQHAKSRCQGYWSEGRAMARGDRRLLTGQQLAQEIKVGKLPGDPGLIRQVPALPDLAAMALQNLSGWMGKTGPSFSSPDEVRSTPSSRRTGSGMVTLG